MDKLRKSQIQSLIKAGTVHAAVFIMINGQYELEITFGEKNKKGKLVTARGNIRRVTHADTAVKIAEELGFSQISFNIEMGM